MSSSIFGLWEVSKAKLEITKCRDKPPALFVKLRNSAESFNKRVDTAFQNQEVLQYFRAEHRTELLIAHGQRAL